MAEDRNKKVASDIAEAVNCFGINSQKVAQCMIHEHRTLQQTFTRVCIEWLKVLSEQEHYDDRNEASVQFAKRLISDNPEVRELFEETHLPFI